MIQILVKEMLVMEMPIFKDEKAMPFTNFKIENARN